MQGEEGMMEVKMDTKKKQKQKQTEKQNRGRQKVPIKRIEKDTARQATFSKRRKGFFKKANELAVLCGVQVTALAFSPAGKLFSFTAANTSLDELMHRCIANDGPSHLHDQQQQEQQQQQQQQQQQEQQQQQQQEEQQPWGMVGMNMDDHLGPVEMINYDDEFWNNWLNELMTDETLNLPPLPLLLDPPAGSSSHHHL